MVATVPLPALSAATRSATAAGLVTSQVVTTDPPISTAAARAYTHRGRRRPACVDLPGPAPLGRRPPDPSDDPAARPSRGSIRPGGIDWAGGVDWAGGGGWGGGGGLGRGGGRGGGG